MKKKISILLADDNRYVLDSISFGISVMKKTWKLYLWWKAEKKHWK